MIDVRIRSFDEANSLHLCDWPATDLNNLLPAVKAWGVMDNDNDEAMFGQIVVDHVRGEAYFEIVFGADD